MSFQRGFHELLGLYRRLSVVSRKELYGLPGLSSRKASVVLQARNEGRLQCIADMINLELMGERSVAKMSGPDVAELLKFISYYCSLNITKKFNSVLSVDIGLQNTAMTHLGTGLKLLEWRKPHLEITGPYSPAKLYDQVTGLFKDIPSADLCLIEQQTLHSPLGLEKGLLQVGIELRTREAMLYAVARKDHPGMQTISVSPTAVGGYFGINTDTDDDARHPDPGSNNKHASNKRKPTSSELVESLIGDHPGPTPLGDSLTVPGNMVDYFTAQERREDLSESLLQALAVVEWNRLAYAS